MQTQKNKVKGVIALSETPYRSSPSPWYPATNMLSAEPSAAHLSGPSPRRIFLNFARRIFYSPIPKLLTHNSNSVVKLTDRKIRWIIREKMMEIHSTKDIALLQNVSGSRIRQIWRYYRITKTVPILAKPGRPSRSITNEEMSAVIGTYKEYPCSAVVLENILDKRYGIKIPHNRIHKILNNHRLASNDTKKQRKRKWVKYE